VRITTIKRSLNPSTGLPVNEFVSISKRKYRTLVEIGLVQQTFELSLALLVGLTVGGLLIFSWRLPSQWQQVIAVVPVAIVLVLLVKDLEKAVLVAIATSIPLNLDVSLVISPYARNLENLASGQRTLVALTELRLTLVSIALVIGYALWLIGPRDSDRKPIRFFASTSVPALGIIFVSVLSMYQSQDLQLSLFQIAQLFELFLMYLYVANHIQTIHDLQFFVTVLMWAVLAESILMVWQWMTGSTFYIAGIQAAVYGDPPRVGGTLGNPNVAGGVISAYLVIVCAMLWIFPKPSQRIFAITCFVTGCIALISTASRSSWGSFLGTLIGFALIVLWRGQVRRKMLGLFLLGVLVVGAIFCQPIYDRLTEDDHGSEESRAMLVKLAWNVIQAHPWLGVGANNYALVAPDYYTSEVGNLGYVIDSSVHNKYLLTWAETGLFGLLFYVSFLVAPLAHIWQRVKSGDRATSLIALGLGCAIISMGIQMFAEHFSERPSTFLIWLLISLAASLHNSVPATATTN
jgi:O-antigen ligase